ncbi:MAG: hypothetical protein J2P27_16945 [Actinobacteria bacterium]|nr:hypothetical protein [Actinomycetota bacterium]
MRVGIADHLGWAVSVAASAEHKVVDRRRIELLGTGLPAAPIHHEGGTWARPGSQHLDDAALAALVSRVRAAALRVTAESLDRLAADLPEPIDVISLRHFLVEFPDDIALLRRPPYEARADAIMYRQVLAEVARQRGWRIHLYDARAVVGQATARLGTGADQVLDAPRATLGPPWTTDHRKALAATILSTGS